MSEQFHLGDILSITTNRLVSPDHIDGVYRIIDYMTGIPHFTHQLPRGADACRPYLLRQHPWLADVVPPKKFRDENHVVEWLSDLTSQYGERHVVDPLPCGDYVGREPLTELAEMMQSGTNHTKRTNDGNS
jgi:hypothetical protein